MQHRDICNMLRAFYAIDWEKWWAQKRPCRWIAFLWHFSLAFIVHFAFVGFSQTNSFHMALNTKEWCGCKRWLIINEMNKINKIRLQQLDLMNSIVRVKELVVAFNWTSLLSFPPQKNIRRVKEMKMKPWLGNDVGAYAICWRMNET